MRILGVKVPSHCHFAWVMKGGLLIMAEQDPMTTAHHSYFVFGSILNQKQKYSRISTVHKIPFNNYSNKFISWDLHILNKYGGYYDIFNKEIYTENKEMKMSILLPSWANYVSIEFDKTLWVSRYDPHDKTLKSNPSTNKVLAVLSGTIRPGTTRIEPSEFDNEPRFMNEDLQLITKTGRPYKEYCLEQALLKMA